MVGKPASEDVCTIPVVAGRLPVVPSIAAPVVAEGPEVDACLIPVVTPADVLDPVV